MSYISGLANVFNIAGNFYDYNYSESDDLADLQALKSDWQETGMDLCLGISYFRENLNSHVNTSALTPTPRLGRK
jgi:hypothetical protein